MGIETALLVAGAVGTGISTIGAIQQGQQAKKQANFEAAQAQADAQAARERGEVEADRIRKAGRRQVGEARSALAKSGVVADAGTAVTIQDYIAASSEEDAMQSILSGGNSANRFEQRSQMLRQSGRNAVGAGVVKAGSSLLAGANLGVKAGWLQQAAPIEERDITRY